MKRARKWTGKNNKKEKKKKEFENVKSFCSTNCADRERKV